MSAHAALPYAQLSGLDTPDSALLETLLTEAPIGFAFFDTERRFSRINKTLAEIHGVSTTETIGRRPTEVLAAALGEPIEAILRRVLQADSPILDTDFPVEVGEVKRYWLSSWFPAHDDDGRVIGVAVLAVEVTERRTADEVVRRSEERYRSLVEATAQVIWVTDPAGQVHVDSPEWRAVTGQTLDEYLGTGWLDAIHPDDRERTGQAWREAVGAGSVFDASYRVRTRSGGYRYYDVRAVPIVRHGEIIEWVGANTDVTAQREAEEMRGRLTEQLSAAALRTARLQQATSMLAEAITVEQVVEVITEVGRSAIGADRSAVALLDPDKLVLHVVNDGLPKSPGSPPGVVPLETPSVLTMAVRERKPFLAETPDSLRDQLGAPEVELFLEHTDERSWIGLPLLAAGTSLGALRFAFCRPRQIIEEERVFLEALAGQCALAVERATLFEREHRTAETLQRSLLPDKLLQLPGVALAARYRPAARHVQVGGDWYDAFMLPDGRLAVAVGDVMGKGVGAAAGMGRVRNALRALALTDPRPAAVLSGLDRLFAATEHEEQVTTLTYIVVDPATGESLCGNAGHPPVLHVSAEGTPTLSEIEPGTPLGIQSGRTQRGFVVAPSNTAVIYSDGLVENRRRGLDAGLEELLAVTAAAAPEVVADPEKLLDYLGEQMLVGYEQDDDVTLLALHVPPITG